MFGFILGFAGLAGLIWTLRRGHCHGRHGHGFGHHHHHHRRHDRWLSRLLGRIDASPAQERLIREEIGDLKDRVKDVFPEATRIPSEVARALRSKAIEPEWFDDFFAEQERHLADIKRSFAEAISRIHAGLTDEQREKLAELIERRVRRGFGPYRSTT